MISIKRLLYGLDMKLNKVATNEHQSIPNEDKILALRKAQVNLIKKRLPYSTTHKYQLDTFKEQYKDIQILVVPNEKITVSHNKDVYDSYVVDINKMKKDYMFLISIIGMCTKGNCTNRSVIASEVIKHSDLTTLMYNTNHEPSFEYQETLATIQEDKVYIYTDETFKVDYAYISYLRYPNKVDIDGYIDLDGNPSTLVDCELEDYLEEELIDLASLELAMITENAPSIQTIEAKLKSNQ